MEYRNDVHASMEMGAFLCGVLGVRVEDEWAFERDTGVGIQNYWMMFFVNNR